MYGLVNSQRLIYVTAISLSVMISLFITLSIDVINPDGVCYLLSAETMEDGLRQATKVCDQAGWPLYAWLIAKTVSITHLSDIHAAFLLNTLLSTCSVWFFILIVQTLSKPGQQIKLLWLATVVILLAKGFNDSRQYIVKDHGYWACSLLALLCCLYFIKTKKWYYAFAWASASIVAMLFRVEGVFFLVGIPFLVWFDKTRSSAERTYAFFQLSAINIIGLIGILIFLGFFPPEKLGRLQEISWERMQHFSQLFQSRAQMLGQVLLSEYAQGDRGIVLALTLVAWYVVYIVTSVSIIYAILIMYAWYQKCLQHLDRERLVLWAYIIINVGVTFFFLLENMFLSKRYLVALTLVLLLWVPFALLYLLNHKPRWIIFTVFLIMALFGIKSIGSFGYSKAYIREAGEWLHQHVPANAMLYSNDILVMYYSQHYGKNIYIQQKAFIQNPILIEKAEFIALRVNKKNQEGILFNMTPIVTFSNKRGDQVNIYQR